MLSFTKENFEKFKKIQNIKEKPWNIEKTLIEKTIKYVNFIKWIPWLKMIAIWNSVAMNSANIESDIDLFIITSQKRLWIVRIFITFIFQILSVRKTKNKHKEKFCLSFFCTTSALNFENIAIENDIYLYYWIAYLKPILNYNNTWEKFIEKNSKWCDFSKLVEIIENNKKCIYYKWNKEIKNNFILDFLENILKNIFIKKSLKSYNNLENNFWVIINYDMLKFHDNDKRKKIRDTII